jgi:nitronate monooxygenase
MAPMFLVSNVEMAKEAMKNGIAACLPSLNFRTTQQLSEALNELNNYKLQHNCNGTYGINLIVQKTNIYYEEHLKICTQFKVPFYITSLGNPSTVIQNAHSYNAKVFCDVTNLAHAQKVYDSGCDAFVAVGSEAGGHSGPLPLHNLLELLQKNFSNMPVIAAGGIANGQGIYTCLSNGAQAVSIGTRFIASTQAPVSEEYKQALVNYKAKDIVMTQRLSGTPCSVINTPYVQSIGLQSSFLEKLLFANRFTKKISKMVIQYLGIKKLENAIKPGSYKTIWSAGKSIEHIHSIETCSSIINQLKTEYYALEAKHSSNV